MSTVEKLRAAILHYLEEKETDYAIMVNGVWGSGKTFFLKHKLFPELAISKKELKLVYVSLFGVTSSEDLNRKIYLEMFPFFNSKVAKTVGTIGKAVLSNLGIAGIDKEDQNKLLETVGMIDANTLIVFDDLERLDQAILIEILGFINQMVEHNNTKVVISANEREVIEIVSKSSVNYKRYIEKVVRHKLLFELDFNDIGNEILKANKIAKEHRGAILEAFGRGESSNLRTLQFVSSLSLKILSSLGKEPFSTKELRTQIEVNSLYFFSSLAIDVKESRMKYLDAKKLASWSMDKPTDFSKIDFSKVEVIDEGNKKKIVDKENNAQQAFFDRYYAPSQMMYMDSLVEYIESGFWDEKRFLEEVASITKFLETKALAGPNRSLETLFTYEVIDDNKIDEVVNEVMEYVEAGEYQIDKYMRVYSALQGLRSGKVIKYGHKKLFRQILKGIARCKDKQPTPYIEDFYPLSESASSSTKEIYSATIARNQEIKAKSFGAESDSHLKFLFADPAEYNRKYLSKKDEEVPGLHYNCTPKEFLKKYSALPNSKKVEFNGVFYLRQKSGIVMGKAELKWMRELSEKLERQTKNERPLISTVNKKGLKVRIDKVIADWAKHEHSLDS